MEIKYKSLIQAVSEASKTIMRAYTTKEFEVFEKAHSQVTTADYASHKQLTHHLSTTYPDIPIISEEGDIPDYNKRKNWDTFWLIDPLDGTKQFIKGIPEFAICIALIKNNTPTFGLIADPITQTIYYTKKGQEIIKVTDNTSTPVPIPNPHHPPRLIWSKSDKQAEKALFVSELKNQTNSTIPTIEKSSALKFIDIIEGHADIYPRFIGSMEWDIAAGHALLKAHTKDILNYDTNKPITYNTESLRNPPFVAC